MASVTFRSSDIITDAQGVWKFKPGIMNRDWVFVRLPLALGEIAKDMGMSGTDHVLTGKFLNVSVGSVNSILTALRNLASPSSGSPRSGTLTVPEYGSYNHCVISNVETGEQKASGKDVGPDGSVTKTYDIEFSITFRQLRA